MHLVYDVISIIDLYDFFFLKITHYKQLGHPLKLEVLWSI